MKQTLHASRSPRQADRASRPGSSPGPNAASLAPPDYGIDFIDRAVAEAVPLQRSSTPLIQAKLTIGAPNDEYEREADRVADQVMRMPAPKLQRACACGGWCPTCRSKQSGRDRAFLRTRPAHNSVAGEQVAPPVVDEVLRSPGKALDGTARAILEPHFGRDFSHVRVHTDGKAAASARAIDARAYTVGRRTVFGAGQYAPRTPSGLRLLAHELTHVVQQGGAGPGKGPQAAPSAGAETHVQRTLGDGHDLTSPRFSRILDLEAAYDEEIVIEEDSSGRGVQAIQQALYDIGYPLRRYGADGEFGSRTKAAVKRFQRDNPPLADDGKVGDETMTALDTRFGARPALPAPAVLAAPWTEACVRAVICPWSPHTIDVLRTRITLKSYDSISWADEIWNGTDWDPDPFAGGGYNTGTVIGVLNSSCEEMAETLYHEVLHAEQPRTHRTTLERESYAYRIGEEFSIAMGLGGDPSLRSTDAEGREFADPAKGTASLISGPGSYPGVTSGGTGEEIIGKAATHGHVRVQRAGGSIYTRPAAVGEKVEGPETLVGELTHPTAGWTCP